MRATRRPPQHLVGRHVGPIRVALYTAKKSPIKRFDDLEPATPWIAPDDALPEHPSVVWRKRRFPKVQPAYRVSSILTVMELVALGLGVGDRTVMLHQGRVVLDVSGEERARMDVPDLLAMFERTRGETITDDALLLG